MYEITHKPLRLLVILIGSCYRVVYGRLWDDSVIYFIDRYYFGVFCISVDCLIKIVTTEYLQPVTVQCATGTLVQSGAVAQFGGEVVQAPVVTPTANVNNMNNQLGTVYATKRRRRNGKRYRPITLSNT